MNADSENVTVCALLAQVSDLHKQTQRLEDKLRALSRQAAEYRAGKRVWKQSAIAYRTCLEEHGIPLPGCTVRGYDGKEETPM